MDPISQYLTAIAQELQNDPAGIGYKGKTDQQQADLLNNTYVIMVPQLQTPRIAQIINQIPFAPNAAAADHVTASKQPITPAVITAVGNEIGSIPKQS